MTQRRASARLGLAACGLLSCAGGGARDAVAPSHDVVAPTATGERNAEGYEYVTRRPLVVMGLAEARGIESGLARTAVDWLADQGASCLAAEQKRGVTIDGAVRVAAEIGRDGRVARTGVRIDPGAGLAQTIVLCLVTPARLMTFPAAESGTRGLAIEALLGRK